MAVLLPELVLDPISRSLVDGYQRDFPLCATPFAVLAGDLGVSEHEVLARLGELSETGAISRVGAVVRPHTAGCSTLAAVAAPPDSLESAAAAINSFPGVNHNYEREHAYTLWFVVTGQTQQEVSATLAGIEAATGLAVLNLPLEQAYHIDLGFSLAGAERPKPPQRPLTHTVSADDRRLLGVIEAGLPLTHRPYAKVSARLGMSEAEVIARLDAMVQGGVISRFGVVVRHRAFGYTANAMTVWDIATEEVDSVAGAFAALPGVSLCYRRPRRLPSWRYNLFTMIHGRDRASAMQVIETLAATAGSAAMAHAVLFSLRCFKQRGAVFSNAGETAA